MKIGSTDISAAYLGSTALQKVYVGSTEVWSSYSYLLDTYTGAAAAYSLRQLRSAYTGYAIKVRRASDNTEQNIGFVDNVLDTTSLASFCSGTNGFVTTWYDQSGNGNNATQTTAANQPKIYDSSTGVVTENGKASISEHSGTYKEFAVSSINFSADTGSFIAVNKPTTTGGEIYALGNNFRLSVNNGQHGYFAGSAYIYSTSSSTNQALRVAFSGTSDAVAVNGASLTTGYAGNLALTFTNMRVYSSFQEFILYNSDQSSNRTGIETNINDFYSIY